MSFNPQNLQVNSAKEPSIWTELSVIEKELVLLEEGIQSLFQRLDRVSSNPTGLEEIQQDKPEPYCALLAKLEMVKERINKVSCAITRQQSLLEI